MNKKELSTKWSKYCNTDKLVDDAIALLKEYNHACTEVGVCALLDKYFTNKEPLIKLFATSKNYIGDMRIASEKEFDRNINGREVRKFFENASQKFYISELAKYADEDGKTILDFLPTGKKMFTIAELPNAEQQKQKTDAMRKFNYMTHETVKSMNARNAILHYFSFFSNIGESTLSNNYQPNNYEDAPVLKRGTKTSRAFNAVCTHYGVDKLHPEEKEVNGVKKTVYPYNKLFAEYSDLVSGLTRKMQFVISLNPLDYLTMSFGVNWISCQNIRSGGHMGGTLSYMLDKVSIITFCVDKIDGDIHKIPKVYRQMYHYEKNLFIQSRLYPQGNDGTTNLYDKFRGLIIDEFTELLGVEGDWQFHVGPEYCRCHAKSGHGSNHYPDYRYNRSCGIFYPENNGPSIKNHVMTIGHCGICVKCGQAYDEYGRLNHYECNE